MTTHNYEFGKATIVKHHLNGHMRDEHYTPYQSFRGDPPYYAETVLCQGRDDNSPRFTGERSGNECSACWHGIAHSEQYHAAHVGGVSVDGSVNGVMNDLKEKLKGLGYRATRANGSAFDINVDGRTHYLNFAEALALSEAPLNHPVDLAEYGTYGGLNYWYTFPRGEGVQ